MFSSWFRRRPAAASRPATAAVAAAPPPAHPHVEQLERRELLAAVATESKIKVDHRFADGLPRNQSEIRIPFSERVRIADADQIQVRGYAWDPDTEIQKKVVLHVVSATVSDQPNNTSLVTLITDRMMRKGGRIMFLAGALEHVADDTAVAAQTVRSPRGLNREDFTLASRAFKPTDLSKFDDAIYSGAPSPDTASTVRTEAQVEPAFFAFLEEKVSRGLITDAERDEAVTLWDNSRARSIITDHNMRAALLSLVGTVSEQAINAVLSDQNATDAPYTFVGFASVPSGTVIADADIRESDGRLRIRFHPDYAGEPFQALSAVLAHEVLHQDTDEGGVEEEVIGNAFENVVWAQQIDVDADPSNTGTRLVAHLNTELLALLNSGRTEFPKVGLLTPWIASNQRDAAIKHYGQGVFFGSSPRPSGGIYTSWENFLRRQYLARGGISKSSAGNNTLNIYMDQFGVDYSGRFNNTVLNLLDTNMDNVLSTSMALRLASILDLTVT